VVRNKDLRIMALKMVSARAARVLGLAGLSLLLGSLSSTVQGADESSIKAITVRGLDGRRVSFAAPDHGATALVFYSTECPISNSYSPTLTTLVDSFPATSVKWLGVCVDPDLSDSEVKAHSRDFGFKFPVVRDRNGTLARKLGAKVTPETFLIDSEGKVRY